MGAEDLRTMDGISESRHTITGASEVRSGKPSRGWVEFTRGANVFRVRKRHTMV